MKLCKIRAIQGARSANQQYPSRFRLPSVSQVEDLASVDIKGHINRIRTQRAVSSWIRRQITDLDDWHSRKDFGWSGSEKQNNVDLPFGILRTKFDDLTLRVFRKST